MEFVCDMKALKNKLATLDQVVYKQASLPLFQHIEIYADAYNGVRLRANNLEQDLVVYLDADVDQVGTEYVEFKALKSFLPSKTPPNKPIMLNSGGGICCVGYDSVVSELPCYLKEDEEFPPTPVIKTTMELDIIEPIKKCLGFVSTEETRHFLNGVYIVSNGHVSVVATDGRALREVKTDQTCKEEFGIIVPTKALKILTTKFPKGPVKVGILTETIGEGEEKEERAKLVKFSADGIQLTTRLIEGMYPDYEMIIRGVPQSVNITCQREELLTHIISMAGALPKKTKNGTQYPVRLNVAKRKIRLWVKSSQGRAEVSMDCEHDANTHFRVSPAYMLDALQTMESETVTLRTGKFGLEPVGIYGDEGNMAVVMPMKPE